MTVTRIVVVADDPFVRDGMKAILDKDATLRVVGEAATLADARRQCGRGESNLILVDMTGHRVNATGFVHPIRESGGATNVPVVLLVAEQSSLDLEALRVGGCAVLRSRMSATQLIMAIRMIAAGYVPVERGLARRLADSVIDVEMRLSSLTEVLTTRERETFYLLMRGMSNAEIANALNVASSTVKSHVQDILRKLRLRNRLEVAIYAYRLMIAGGDLTTRDKAVAVTIAGSK